MNEYTSKSVLVVDDDTDLLAQLQLRLSKLGFEVIAAESQSGAEAAVETKKPDLAVIDLMMEHEDSGFVLAHRLKQRYPDLPVIMMTAVTSELGIEFDASTNEERRFIRADALINKPMRFEQLQREIARLVAA